MTAYEVATYLRVTVKTIYRLLKRGAIPAIRIDHQWRFERNSIDNWLRRKAVEVRVRILVVDDDAIIRALFKETLEDLGHRVITAETGSQGLELVKEQDFDLVFLDLKMTGMNGDELFCHIKTIRPKLPVTIITGYPDSEMMEQVKAQAQAPVGVMNKPFGESDIVAAVSSFGGD